MAEISPRLTKEEIQEHLDRYSREPFKKMLVSALANEPTAKHIQKFANKAPDRYAQYITQFAKLAGYNEKIEIEHKLKPLNHYSDAELLALRDELDKQVGTIELQPVSQPPKQVEDQSNQ